MTTAGLAVATWTLLGGCRRCGTRYRPAPGVLEALGAALFAVVASSGVTGWAAAAHYWLAACAVPLIAIDLAVHRLPDVFTVPAAVGTLAFLAVADVVGEPGSFPRAAMAAAVLGVAFAAVALGGAGLGMGDVKLAPAVGALLGWHSWDAVLQGVFVSFASAAVFAAVLLVRRKATTGEHRFAFGPFLLVGALLVAAAAS